MSPPRWKTASRNASRKSRASPSILSRPTPPDPILRILCDRLQVVAHHAHLHRLSSVKFHAELKRVSSYAKTFQSSGVRERPRFLGDHYTQKNVASVAEPIVCQTQRFAQWEMLELTRKPRHVPPKFPAGYWPKTQPPPDSKAWSKSADAFRADLKAMIKIVQNKSTDFFAPLPHGDGQTVLREALLVADHNAYHLGELLLLRRLLGAWK